MQKSVPEKQPKKQSAKNNTDRSVAVADKAFVLSMGESFSQTAFCKAYHETFGVTLSTAKSVFEQLVAKKAVVPAQTARRYGRGPAIPPQCDLVRLVGNRTGDFKIKSLSRPDKIVDRIKSTNPESALLPDDVVFGVCRMADDPVFQPQILVRRPRTELVCRLGYANRVCIEGCGSVIANRLEPKGEGVWGKDRKALKGKVFTVRLDEACCKPFSAIKPLKGSFVKFIGSVDSTQTEIDMTLERLSIPSEFSKDAMAQAQALPDVVDADAEVVDRVDLRDIGLVTIDGEDARDFDDAVWCAPQQGGQGGWRLLVAIADVSHYVTPASALDADAQQRCTSVYFPTRVVPMLPEMLSNGLCSLNPGVDRCSMVCDMLISAQGEITAYQFYPALIRSKARLTYTSVWNALNGDAQDFLVRGGNLTDIGNLYALFKVLLEARHRRGAADFTSSETEIATDEQTQKIIAIRKRDHNDAHRLIEECMLAANVCAADFVHSHKAKCLYRVHDAPAADRLTALRSTLSCFGLKLEGGLKPTPADYAAVAKKAETLPAADVINSLLLRSMQRAVYSPVLKPHYGLNYESYTHFTSPIRRYPDLLVHRTIRSILEGRRYVPTLAQMPEEMLRTRMLELASSQKAVAQQQGEEVKGTRKSKEDESWEALGLLTSAAERRADEASRDIVAWMKADYMAKYRNKCFEGVITGANPAGVYVTLTEIFVEGFVHVSRLNGWEYFRYDPDVMCFEGEFGTERFMIGDKVTVRVLSAVTDTRRIDFEMVKNHTDATRSRGTKNKKTRRRFG